ncbi:sigma-54-dependent Fis family transcriptional regulator [Mesorhizobium atlanticum]|nr:sigma 54-interacting transcriptional regulator [Mesorhizobium atlanticum]
MMLHPSGIDRARQALERGDRLPGGTLPAAIAESWQRCRDLGLDPRSIPNGEVTAFAEVTRKREKVAALRRLALAEMKLLHSQIAGSNFIIALGDAEGMVLDTISDQHFADSTAGRSVIPGSIWSEARYGTNALGLAAAGKEAVAVYGREHYFACHGHLSCMAAPILDSNGRILGLLDASCSNEARQQHTHALVRMAAAQIENGLIFQERAECFILAFHPRAEYLDTLSAGLIAVSRDGEVISLNRPGTSLLAGLPAAAGSHFDHLFEASFGATISGLLNGGVTTIRDRAGSGVFMVCRQIAPGGRVSPARRSGVAPAAHVDHAPDFVCEDRSLKRAVAEIGRAAALRMPIHITGETGTGKELMARHVHTVSGRKGEFVAVNCGAVPEQLFIAEIFGHERGAYTNARSEGSPGLARIADRGTLFLDEVADIPLPAQTALLRFLDSMEIRAVGGQHTHRVDVQIVSATNRDLSEMVAERSFRADLLYRLNAFTLHLPPLGARSDFALIVRHLMRKLAPDAAITDAAITALSLRKWPGNIRELQAALQRALVRGVDFVDEGSFDDCSPPDETDSCVACRGNSLDENRCREIRRTYRNASENISETARRLGLSRTTVYKHLGL